MERNRFKAVLVDIEGTVFVNGEIVPGVPEAIEVLSKRGVALRFVTNIDSRPPDAVVAQLQGAGLPVSPGDVFTPISAARSVLAAEAEPRVYLVGSAEVAEAIGGVVAEPPFSHVVVGDCRAVLDYGLLDGAFRALRQGARLIALQRGRYMKAADGDHIDTGAVVAALEYSSGLQAHVVGKPEPGFFAQAGGSARAEASECAVVGDDAASDIAGAKAAGMFAIQVRTGKFGDYLAGGGSVHPDLTIDSLADLPGVI